MVEQGGRTARPQSVFQTWLLEAQVRSQVLSSAGLELHGMILNLVFTLLKQNFIWALSSWATANSDST